MALEPPDISAFGGEDAASEYVQAFDSGKPGPNVVINALCHGNEICGVIALDRLVNTGIRPLRGRLTLVLANVAAYLRFDTQRPYASRYVDEDFNRVWSDAVLDGSGDSIERRRARVLRPIYRQADALLDLHSMTTPCEPLVLCGRTERARTLASALGYPRWVISDSGHAGGRRLIDYGAFASETGAALALLVECGQHWHAESADVAFAMCLLFLKHFDLIDAETAVRRMPSTVLVPTGSEAGSLSPRLVDVTDVVTAAADGFVFAANYSGIDVVPRAGTIIGYQQGRPVRTPYDDCVLVMPARSVRRGETVVRLGRVVSP